MRKKQTKPEIPFVLLHDEAENKIFNAVNEAVRIYKIPYPLIENILTNLLHQVREYANNEKAEAARLYNEQLAEYNKAKEAEKAEKEVTE